MTFAGLTAFEISRIIIATIIKMITPDTLNKR